MPDIEVPEAVRKTKAKAPKRSQDSLFTPQKSQFLLSESCTTSTPRKSFKTKFPSESSENKENDDSAIFMMETLSISSSIGGTF